MKNKIEQKNNCDDVVKTSNFPDFGRFNDMDENFSNSIKNISPTVEKNLIRQSCVSIPKENGQSIIMSSKELSSQFYQGEKIITDKIEALNAVSQNGYNLEYVSSDLKNDKEVILAAIEQETEALKSAKINIDRAFALQLVQVNAMVLEYLSPLFQDDKKIVMTAINQDPYSFQFASPRLRGDKKIALFALNHSWDTDQFVSEEIKKIIGDDDGAMVANLEFAIASEKLSKKLNQDLTGKITDRKKKI